MNKQCGLANGMSRHPNAQMWVGIMVELKCYALKRNRVELQIFMNYEKSDVIGYKTEQSDGKKVILVMI